MSIEGYDDLLYLRKNIRFSMDSKLSWKVNVEHSVNVATVPYYISCLGITGAFQTSP